VHAAGIDAVIVARRPVSVEAKIERIGGDRGMAAGERGGCAQQKGAQIETDRRADLPRRVFSLSRHRDQASTRLLRMA
jgi:hypothetical protein